MDKLRHLSEADKKYLWHPFTQMKEWVEGPQIIIAEGNGCYLKDIEGKHYLDGVSSLWVNIHGHRKKKIDDAIKKQVELISHSTLLGLGNVPSIELAEKIVSLTGPDLSKVFYSDNGSTSVEVSLKMAFQYWAHKGIKGKNSFLSLNNAYHGDTLGAVSVGGIDIFHETFRPLLFKSFRAPSPYCYRCELGMEYPSCGLACAKMAEKILAAHHDEIAAMIVEPLVQAAGGMIVSPPGYLGYIAEACKKNNVLFIADEVATGFGRTGKMFACNHESVYPDIMCLSKGITGGYLPLAVTVTNKKIYDAFLGDFGELKTFFHGHSYTGNPLGCAAALACLDVFDEEKTLENLGPKIKVLEERLRKISVLEHVGSVRNCGMMAGIELVRNKDTKKPYPYDEKMGWRVVDYARSKGLIIRPLGNVVVIMPPLAISNDDLAWMLDVISDAIISVT